MMRAQYYRAADVVVHRVVRSETPRDVNYLLIFMYIPIYPSTSDESCTVPVKFISYTSIGNESGAKISAFT